jgi:hypothetical protein
MQISNTFSINLIKFESANLDDLNSFKLQNRVDQKFVFREEQLNSILDEISSSYKVLTIENKQVFKYSTLYFDTPNYVSYFDHHNGKPNRSKIRYRKYENSGDVFFEIKKKIKGYRTNKFRIPMHEIPNEIGDMEIDLLKSCFMENRNLKPSIWVNYERITLVSKDNEERVTIDLNVEYKNEERAFPLERIIIVEVKQPRISRTSSILKCLREKQIRETKISKYSIGVALLNSQIKQNAFGSKLRKIRYLIDKAWKQAS